MLMLVHACPIYSDAPLSIFAASSGIITTTTPLDFESQSVYNVIVIASDGGTPPLQFSFFMALSVLDENDNTPRFMQQSYTAMVPENSAENTFVTNLEAVDEDSGTNAEIVYSFVATGQSSAFSIDNTSGIVSVLRPEALNFEVASSRILVLQVLAQDRGSPPASSQTVVSEIL